MSTGTARSDAPGILDRVDSILDVIAAEGCMTLTQITEATSLPRTTVHRLLEQMVAKRWVLRIRNEYEIGVRPFHLGTLARQGHWYFRLARPHLETMRERTRLVVHLGYLDGTDVVWWDKVGDTRLSLVPTYVGGRHPSFRTAAGKALLASEGPDYIATHYAEELGHTTPESLKTRDELLEETRQIREEGLARSRGELLPHLSCLATPVTVRPVSTSDGHQTATAVSVCGPVDRIESDTSLAHALRTCAMDILADIAQSPRAPKD
ncbi:IclR family transcriptional regulator [Dietzia sp. ANT_WB102]|uniref:IclR family transcriptional regulator n=1 Tax=Dietzia sp. ANT_WB102 TaxID=2597345 RepID=UPI0011EEBB04|nr:IclR family transcriptional regulator [Dietzia sp. ANT_WB102]KAA0918024.1 IclR family transcriptional regulator [Dietzia sp. ANT_WB102]